MPNSVVYTAREIIHVTVSKGEHIRSEARFMRISMKVRYLESGTRMGRGFWRFEQP